MRAVIQTATGKAEEEPIVEPSATTTTPPVVVLGADPRRQRSTGRPSWASIMGCRNNGCAAALGFAAQHYLESASLGRPAKYVVCLDKIVQREMVGYEP